jgi:hypothetical protein
MLVFGDTRPIYEAVQCILKFSVCGIMDWLPCQEDQVPSILDEWNTLSDDFSNSAFGSIPFDRVAYRTPRCHTKSREAFFIGMFDQHNKRVGIRLSCAPHPPEIS